MKMNKIERRQKEARRLYKEYLEMFDRFHRKYEMVWRGRYQLVAKVNPVYKNHPLYNDARELCEVLNKVYLGKSKEFTKRHVADMLRVYKFQFDKLTPKQQREFFFGGLIGYSVLTYKKMFIPTVVKYMEPRYRSYQSIPDYMKMRDRLFRERLWYKYLSRSRDRLDDKGKKKREQKLFQQQVEDGLDYLFGG